MEFVELLECQAEFLKFTFVNFVTALQGDSICLVCPGKKIYSDPKRIEGVAALKRTLTPDGRTMTTEH